MSLLKLENLIVIVFVFTIFGLHAQTDFRPGYIIEVSGDTLFGEIDYRGDRLMSSVCKFKNSDSKIKEYFPSEISAFRFIDSKYYVAKEINSIYYFLEYLLDGQVSLFYMRNNGDQYFLYNENLGLKELIYEEGIKQVGGRTLGYKTTQHRDVLKMYMEDAPKLLHRTMSFEELKHKTLLRLLEDYNDAVCNIDCVIYEKIHTSMKVDLEFLSGVHNFSKSADLDQGSKFHAGFLLHLKLSRSNEKLYLRTGVVSIPLEINESGKASFKIPLQFEYVYPRGSFRPKFAGGFNFYSPLGFSSAFMGGVNIAIGKSASISLNYDIDFATNENIRILPKSFNSQAFTAGILFHL